MSEETAASGRRPVRRSRVRAAPAIVANIDREGGEAAEHDVEKDAQKAEATSAKATSSVKAERPLRDDYDGDGRF